MSSEKLGVNSAQGRDAVSRKFSLLRFSLLLAFLVGSNLAGVPAQAQEVQQLSLFEKSLMESSSLYTKESIVSANGREFRKIEYKSDTFYLQLARENGKGEDLNVVCGKAPGSVSPNSEPARVQVGVKVTKRTTAFISGLKAVCDPANRSRAVFTPALEAGFLFDDSKPNATLKNRKITVNPFSPSLGLSADW